MSARGRFPLRLVFLVLPLVAVAGPARAHEGPPYPIVVDRAVGPHVASVWADPDVGTGTFFVSFDPDAYRGPSDPRVAIEVWPSSGRLARVSYPAVRQRDGAYRAEVAFDREESWQTRLMVEGSGGRGETVFEVAVTPPGYGRWDVVIYLAPFLILGGFWALVALRKRRLPAGSV